MEAARVPQQLLGELFVEKGLITREELAQALAEQKTSDKRIGQILVQMGFVSRPALATVLAEQLGVELSKQEGFGAGLWSEIKRRHPRGKPDSEENDSSPPGEPVGVQELEQEQEQEQEQEARSDVDEHAVHSYAEPDELESLRQQLAFASTRLEEERAAHQGTQRLLEESRVERASRVQEADDWRERAIRAEGSREKKEHAAADLAKLEATAAELRAELEAREQELQERNASEALVQSLSEQVEALRVKSEEAWRQLEDARTEAVALDGTVTELRAELEARDAELGAGAEVQTQLADEAGRLEDELKALRDQQSGSKDAIAALTAQVDELRAGGSEAQRLVDEAHVEAAALEASVVELRSELDKAREENSQSQAAVTTLTERLDEQHASREELERKLTEARAEAAAFEATAGELREELSNRGDAGMLEQELTAVREEVARLEQASEQRKAKVRELAQELRNAQESAAGLEQLVGEREQALARETESRAALEAEAAKLRREAPRAGELEQQLSTTREEIARLEQVSEQRKAKVKELQSLLEDERARFAAATAELEQGLRSSQEEASRLEQLVAERERVLVREVESRTAVEAEARELRRQAPKASELEQELTAVREEMARLERVSEQRKTKVKELQALLEGERAQSAAATAGLEQGLRSSQEEASRLEQLVAEREQARAREAEARAVVQAELEALQAEAAELRCELPKTGELEQELTAAREELARLGQISEQRKTKVNELAQELREARDSAAGLEQLVADRERSLAHEADSRAALEAEAAKLRRELPRAGELHQELTAVREEVARLEQIADKRKTKVKELRALFEDERASSATRAADLAQELTSAQNSAAALGQRLSEREQALAREADARDAVVAELASLAASADALDQRLQEECAAHVATRRELGRMEAELAELQPLTDKLAATESELSACARLLEEVSAGLESAKGRLGDREYDPDRHVVFMPLEGVYALAERPGPSPAVGAYEDVDGVRFLVTRIGSSPLPADRRRCAYLEVA